MFCAAPLAFCKEVWYNRSMKKNTVYEDREEKRRKDIERHTLACPHCGKPVLDHMTECPHCKEKLKPTAYQPLSDEKIKKIRIITYSVGAVVAIALIVYLIFFR